MSTRLLRLFRAAAPGIAALILTSSPRAQDADAGPQPPWASLGLHRAIDWTMDPETFLDGRSPKRSLTREVDRIAMIEDAIATSKREGKLVMWYVYRVIEDSSRGRQMYRAPVLDLYAMQVLFNDPDVCDIVESHFVPLRMVCDEPLAARFGLRPLEFVEPAVVFVNGEGEVVHCVERIRTFDGLWFARLLGRVLDAAGVADIAPEDAMAAGQYERALAAIPKDDLTPTAHFRRAQLLRRLTQLDAALTALDAARGTEPCAWHTERGRVLTLAGRPREAIAEFERALAAAPPSAARTAAEAQYYHAVNSIATGDHDAARAHFEQVGSLDPDGSFGARARANLAIGKDDRAVGASLAGFENIRALGEAAYRGLPRDTQWPGPALEADEIVARATDLLLSMQRDDGAFADCRYAYWPNPEITPNAWVAITSLAAAALHAHREVDPTRIDDAVGRAETFAFDPDNLRRGLNEDVYADTFRLTYLVERHLTTDDESDRSALVDRMNRILAAAAARQRDSGFFAHEYPNAFCTAAMLWSAHRARGAGAEVPIDMISRGITALVSARREDGAFAYSGAVANRTNKTWTLKDSSTRMPICEGVLRAFGESDDERVRFAFDTYWEHMDRIERVRRNDFHSDGELGGFFFFHSLFHTAEVIPLLDEEQRRAQSARMLALLQRIAEMDGSYVDSHEIGKAYGTAMALLVLARIGAD